MDIYTPLNANKYIVLPVITVPLFVGLDCALSCSSYSCTNSEFSFFLNLRSRFVEHELVSLSSILVVLLLLRCNVVFAYSVTF